MYLFRTQNENLTAVYSQQLIRTLLVCTWNFDVCSTVNFARHVFCYALEDSLVHMDCVSNVQGPMIVIFSSNLQNGQQVSRLAYGIAVPFTMLCVKFSVTFELIFNDQVSQNLF